MLLVPIAASSGAAAERPFSDGVVVLFPAARSPYIPLARRTSGELARNAAELRCMAQTATTADVVRALCSLADRYAALAEKRRAEETSGP